MTTLPKWYVRNDRSGKYLFRENMTNMPDSWIDDKEHAIGFPTQIQASMAAHQTEAHEFVPLQLIDENGKLGILIPPERKRF